MKAKIDGLIQLTRTKEYSYFVLVTSFVGIAAADGQFGVGFVLVLAANWLMAGFAFMLNDVQDAPYDAFNQGETRRNPVSAGLISTSDAKIATYLTALVALIFYAVLGWKVLLCGLFSLGVGILYSHRSMRVKTVALLDMASHCWLLAGLFMMSGYFAFQSQWSQELLFPFLMVVCLSLYGELSNELRHLQSQPLYTNRYTLVFLGERVTHILMILLLTVGSISGVLTLFFQKLIPLWVIVLIVILVGILVLPAFLKMSRSQSVLEMQMSFYKPLEKAAALALLVYYLAPIVINLFTH